MFNRHQLQDSPVRRRIHRFLARISWPRETYDMLLIYYDLLDAESSRRDETYTDTYEEFRLAAIRLGDVRKLLEMVEEDVKPFD